MLPENFHFEFCGCTALKVSGIFHDVTGNQSETEFCIQETLNKMNEGFCEFA